MKQPTNSKTFCILPWIHVNGSVGGYYRPCCNSEEYFPLEDDSISILDAFNSKEMYSLRQYMIEEKEHPSCKVCYDREKNGGLSFRHTYTVDKFKEFVDPEKLPVIKYLDMRFDNSCNLACRMCDPSSSNQLIETIDIFKKEKIIFPSHWKKFENKNIKNQEELSEKRKKYVLELLPNINVFKITGGEPFISKDFLEVLDVAIEKGYSKNIILLITTNGTKFVKLILDRLLYFKGIDMNVSVDGSGYAYNYIRYPFNWDKWCERFEEFLQFADDNKLYNSKNFRVRTSTIVTAYNWLNCPDLYIHLKNYSEKFTWLKGINYIPRIDFNLNLRPADSELSAKWLPKNLLEKGLDKWRTTNYRQVKEFENYVAINTNEEMRVKKNKDLKYFTLALDKQRNQDFRMLDEDFSNWLEKVDV